MGSVKFAETTLINEVPRVVFDYTQDYRNRLIWDTFLKKAELIDGANCAAVGVKAYCIARNGLSMETEYVTFTRPKVTAIKMTKGPFLFSSFLGSWMFKEAGSDQTEVTFLYSFKLRFPFSLATFFIKSNLKKNVRKRLRDLKSSIECK